MQLKFKYDFDRNIRKYILATAICRAQFLNYLLLDNFLVHL
jgi:hypothetical protein